MIYFIRVLYAWLLPPGLYLVAFLAAYFLFIKTKKKSWFLLPFTVMYLLSTYIVSSMLIKPLEYFYKQPAVNELKVSQAIVLLSGGTYYGVPDVDGKSQLTASSANRLLTALRLYKSLKVPVIVSGSEEEAKVSYRLLKSCGMDEKDIFIENKSQNTAQNAKFTSVLCQQKGLNKILLVTSAYHLPRATMLFQREKIDVIPYPTDYRTHGVKVFNLHVFTPTYEALSNSAIALKECLGILAIKVGLLQ